MKNALIWAAVLAVVILLCLEAKGQPKPPVHHPMFCASDVGLFVPCREADRIRRMEWRI
jgi:hypothetical protein